MFVLADFWVPRKMREMVTSLCGGEDAEESGVFFIEVGFYGDGINATGKIDEVIHIDVVDEKSMICDYVIVLILVANYHHFVAAIINTAGSYQT